MSAHKLTPKQLLTIRNARLRCGVTQTELAARLGFTSQFINMVERGKRPTTADALRRWGAEIGLEIKCINSVTITTKKGS